MAEWGGDRPSGLGFGVCSGGAEGRFGELARSAVFDHRSEVFGTEAAVGILIEHVGYADVGVLER